MALSVTSRRTASVPSPPYENDTSRKSTSAGAESGSVAASSASTTSGVLSRISSIRPSDASPAAHTLESIVIITSGVIVVSR